MSKVKMICWNMQWMNDMFDENKFKDDDENIGRGGKSLTVKEKYESLFKVLNDIGDFDVIVITEAPNRTKELQLFFDKKDEFGNKYLEGDWEALVQNTKGSSQCIGIGIRKDKFKDAVISPSTELGIPGSKINFFDTRKNEVFDEFRMDVENDGIEEVYVYERRPLYVQLTLLNDEKFRILGVHFKSKGIFAPFEWSNWWARALANRMKIFATVTNLRNKFIEPYLAEDETKDVPLIICGDINDGPGFDTSERKILGSGIEKLMGDVWKPEFILGNAIYDTEKKLDLSTTSFPSPIFNRTYHKVWIDHILYTKNINNDSWISNGKILNEFGDNKTLWQFAPDSSDHNPICAEIDLN